METIVDLQPEVYRVAQERATERGVTIGKVLGDALLGRHPGEIGTDEQGWPVLRTGHPVTTKEIKAMIAEDEEGEITRGDPDHPYYANGVEGEPIVTRGPTGLPQIRFRRSDASEQNGTGH